MRNQAAKLSDLFHTVLEYALPGATWKYHGTFYDNKKIADIFLPLFLLKTKTWLDVFSDSNAWGFGSGIIINNNNGILSFVLSEDECLTPLLLFALEVAIYASEQYAYQQVILLDFLDDHRIIPNCL